MTRTSSTGIRVDVSYATAEVSESGAVPRASQEGVKAECATIEGWELKMRLALMPWMLISRDWFDACVHRSF